MLSLILYMIQSEWLQVDFNSAKRKQLFPVPAV